ncbi:DUF4179 domain-containing protein [Bacillus sp. V3B]|uniref:DUF4179 domain-containing protein n=1 Tax=Bacillus sp. V3B TaxID=2804915 RepID=UPI00210E68B2|nr:DUF4179 domain-containing protein [Bacillus sp. V3B]MCQ6276635.1 DUF4179 domain-containing protein [Bacillus sp. V3B]
MKKQFDNSDFDNSLKKLESDFKWRKTKKQELRNQILADIEKMEFDENKENTSIPRGKIRHKPVHLIKRKKVPKWLINSLAAIVILGLSTTFVAFAFPSIASQIPFMDNVIHFINDKEQHYKNFENFSTDIGLADTSNGVTVMIDNAVYDGTNVTVSFAIETDHNFDEHMRVRAPNWFYVREASGVSGGGIRFTKISENRYVGMYTFTPDFKDNQHPETIEVTWQPESFYSPSNDLEVKGDWSFAFSLNRLEGDFQLVNQTIQKEGVSFTLQSIEFTDVSTVISYKQVVSDELLKEWESVTPVFRVTDDLGNVYKNGTGGGGKTTDDYKTYKGTSDFGTIKEGASQLIIQPIEIASLNYGKGNIEIELEPIIIDLKNKVN